MMLRRFPSVSKFLGDVQGAAAAEFVLMLPLLIAPLIAMIDLGIFVVQRMQVDTASRAGVAAAWHVCDDPGAAAATEGTCEGGDGDLAGSITAAIQSTTLGTGVTLASEPVVGWYCADDAGELISVSNTWAISGTAEAKPADCSGVITDSDTPPAQYIQVTVNFTYTPVFGVLRDAGVLPTTITRTSWWRLT
jgi:hypothetical protein